MLSFSDEVVRRSFRRLLTSINSPLSNSVLSMLVMSDDLGLASLKAPDAQNYASAAAFRDDYAAVKFLSKWKGLNTGIDTAAVAINAWIGVEEKCRDTNRRMTAFRAVPEETPAPIRERIVRAQAIIQRVIGPSPDVRSIFKASRFSGGATLRTRRGASIDEKLIPPIAVTRRASRYLCEELLDDPAWLRATYGYEGCPLRPRELVELVEYSRTITVPKDAKTDRTIGVEPAGNSFLQQSVHLFLRERLRKVGVDLDDQGVNQRLAQKAYTEHLATLDLKSASDSIARELVFLLLPINWARLLDDLRTSSTRINNEEVRLEKFSAMGNAFTFELETLIFWSLCRACSNEHDVVSAYGDDLIVNQGNAGECIELLEWCGFTINLDKSFLSGKFFESCGKHYFEGIDVTPVYQKAVVADLSEHIRHHNRLFRWLVACEDPSRLVLAKSLWRQAMDLTNQYGRRCLLPEDAVDDRGFLTLNGWVEDWHWDPNHGLKTMVWVFVPNSRQANDDYLYAYKLRHVTWSSARPDGRAAVTARGGVWAMRKAYVHTSWEICGR